ncbi:MAG: hypothetical protein ACRDF4_07995 [Rhabdochlamydiaceae bacterium]
MKRINAFALALLILAIILGTALGVLTQDGPSSDQKFSFDAFSVYTQVPVTCGSIPKNSTDWLGINVIGNRTGMSFSRVTIYAPGLNIGIDLPLSGTAFVEYSVTNSTFETIIAPLPNYFDPGDVLTMSLIYTISTYPTTTLTLNETAIIQGNIAC